MIAVSRYGLVSLAKSECRADRSRFMVRAIWLVAVHADRDPELQRRLLDALEPMAARGDLSAQDVAQLADKIHVARGEPQRYGTQFRAVGGVKF